MTGIVTKSLTVLLMHEIVTYSIYRFTMRSINDFRVRSIMRYTSNPLMQLLTEIATGYCQVDSSLIRAINLFGAMSIH